MTTDSGDELNQRLTSKVNSHVIFIVVTKKKNLEFFKWGHLRNTQYKAWNPEDLLWQYSNTSRKYSGNRLIIDSWALMH